MSKGKEGKLYKVYGLALDKWDDFTEWFGDLWSRFCNKFEYGTPWFRIRMIFVGIFYYGIAIIGSILGFLFMIALIAVVIYFIAWFFQYAWNHSVTYMFKLPTINEEIAFYLFVVLAMIGFFTGQFFRRGSQTVVQTVSGEREKTDGQTNIHQGF